MHQQQHLDALLAELFDEGDAPKPAPCRADGGGAAIPGLCHLRGLLDEQQQATLLQHVSASGWFDSSDAQQQAGRNQVMQFAPLPAWLAQLEASLPLSQHWPPQVRPHSCVAVRSHGRARSCYTCCCARHAASGALPHV